MDVKNNGVSAAMKYKDDAECVAASSRSSSNARVDSIASARINDARRVTGILKDVFMS